jgi:glycerol-3-phosphate dehydrogenase
MRQDTSQPRFPGLRDATVERLPRTAFDVLVVGGGVNGAVSAAALSARGARVALLERGDFASATSQQSSNLVWGGIKYLESYELGLVRRLCRARNRLLRAYPSSVEEIRFYTTHTRGFRHGRLTLALGAWLYWVLGGCFTRRPRLLSRADMAAEEPALELAGVDGGFEYSDAHLPEGDARFVWGFVRAALDHGCAAANYVEVLGARREGEGWTATVRDRPNGRTLELRARVLVNACGPWADRLNRATGVHTAHRHVFSKGIHLVVRRLVPGPRVLTFFADDGRLFFVTPLGGTTCIGTTDTPVEEPEVEVTPADRRFVLDNINKRLRLPHPLTEADIVAERCGVRPLVVDDPGDAPASSDPAGGGAGDWMQLSRRHAIDVDPAARQVTVFGGKLTDCLNVGEEVCAEVARLGVALPEPGRCWYGEPPQAVRDGFLAQAARMGLDGDDPAAGRAARLWRRHGREALTVLEAIRRDPRGAEELLPGYLRAELELVARREMVVELEDLLRRRTGLAQSLRPEELLASPGLAELCAILFGERAEARRAAWAATQAPAPAPSGAADARGRAPVC